MADSPYRLATIPEGPPGEPGETGDSFLILSRETAGALSALRAVWEDADGIVRVLDAADVDHIELLIGITITAAVSSGQMVDVQTGGVLNASGLGLSPGPVWLGNAGQLTQTPPATGFDVYLGNATDNNRMYVNLSEPLALS